MKKSFIIINTLLLMLYSLNIGVYAAPEDGTWYNTAITITDFYNIPVVNCDGDEGLVYKFTAPATATYTSISVCNYDKTIQIEMNRVWHQKYR